MLFRPLTPQELEAVAEAARIAVQTYDMALQDAQTKIPTPVHAAMFRLKNTLEGK